MAISDKDDQQPYMRTIVYRSIERMM